MKGLSSHRRFAKLTQQELAELVGVSHITVSRWETGYMQPSLSMAQKLAELFGCSIEDLF